MTRSRPTRGAPPPGSLDGPPAIGLAGRSRASGPLGQVLLGDDGVAAADTLGLVPGQLHGHRPRDARALAE